MSYMEILSMQKSFLDKSGINVDDYKNTFIRKTYTLLLLEFLCLCAISLIGNYFKQTSWIFWIILVICQICHFYFEFSSHIADQSSRIIWNYIFITIFLLNAGFALYFMWTYLQIDSYNQLWRIYIQLGAVILLLNFYANMTSTHFEGEECWIIVLITPLIIEFFLNFFIGAFAPLQQTFITMLITWIGLFMLYITKEHKINKEFTFDELQVLCCKLLGVQFQLIVLLVRTILKYKNDQEDLSIANYEIKFKFFRQLAIFFSIATLILQFSSLFGCFDNNFCIPSLFISISGDIIQNVKLTALFWISFSIIIILYPIILFFHRKLNNIITWSLVIIELIFYAFTLLGFSWFLVVHKQTFTQYQERIIGYQYLYSTAYCMLTGLGIGFAAYASIKKDDIIYKKAFLFMIACPTLIFISQIYYASVNIYPIVVAYSALLLLLCIIYSFLILCELHLQLHKDKIDINAKEYQIGAMLILQPIQTIIIRIGTLFVK